MIKLVWSSFWKNEFTELIDRFIFSPLRSWLLVKSQRGVCVSKEAKLRVSYRASVKVAKKASFLILGGEVSVGYFWPKMRRFSSSEFTSIVVSDEGSVEVKGNAHLCPGTVIAVSERAKLIISEDVFVSSNVFIHSKVGISIGAGTMISWGVTIMDNDLHEISSCSTGAIVNTSKPISIGNHVLIGHHATLLKGVSIGEGAIIGANAVVAHDVPGFSSVAGNPAKIIKENVCWK